MAASEPGLPLYVVSEFAPERGLWIPYHVQRPFRENLASISAALRGRRIERADLVLAPDVPLGKMRIIAALLAPASGEPGGLGPIFPAAAARPSGLPRCSPLVAAGRASSEAEIPLRARAAQVYGVARRPVASAAEGNFR